MNLQNPLQDEELVGDGEVVVHLAEELYMEEEPEITMILLKVKSFSLTWVSRSL
jgi:hypothetical protein